MSSILTGYSVLHKNKLIIIRRGRAVEQRLVYLSWRLVFKFDLVWYMSIKVGPQVRIKFITVIMVFETSVLTISRSYLVNLV